jgi:hypothetical protein
MSDRTVHAILVNGAEIVRYDRAGKWYYESSSYRRHLTITEAVEFVGSPDQWIPDLPGGSAFDRRIRAKFKGQSWIKATTAIDALARWALHHAAEIWYEQEGWETLAELGQFDWEKVAERMSELLPDDVTGKEFTEAYELLAERAGEPVDDIEAAL